MDYSNLILKTSVYLSFDDYMGHYTEGSSYYLLRDIKVEHSKMTFLKEDYLMVLLLAFEQ
jgi:uncharacterized protein (DUF1919 family)